MSVLARLRGKSCLDVEDLAEKIQGEATRLVWNTNNVPKGWRDTFAKPMCALTVQLIHQIDNANSIKYMTDEQVEQRKEEVRKAKVVLRDMYKLINYMGNTLPIDWNKFDTLLNMMIEEEKKLTNWREAVKKVEPKKKKQERASPEK